MSFIYIFLLVLLFSFCHSSSSEHRVRHRHTSRLENEYHLRSIEINKHWRCSVPKPKLVYLDSNTSINFISEPNISFFPKVAVLHRCCDQSVGCCLDSQLYRCRPNQTEVVSLAFRKSDILRLETTYVKLSFLNHTHCSCE